MNRERMVSERKLKPPVANLGEGQVVSVKVPFDLLEEFDAVCKRDGKPYRNAEIRRAMRMYINNVNAARAEVKTTNYRLGKNEE